MSTIAPGAALAIGAELERRGHRFIDAPVTGSSPAADGGTLTIMAGGDEADVDAARPPSRRWAARSCTPGRPGTASW